MPSLTPLERLRRLWQDGTAPATLTDLAALASECRLHSLEELVPFLRLDQQERWRRQQPVPTEDYLVAFPALAASLEDALVLVCGEYDLLGTSARIEDFCDRFPNWADRLRLQLNVHQAFGTASWEGATVSVPTPRPRPAPPQVPGYEILGELGHGGMGVVYRARQVNLDREVALKVLRLESPSPTLLSRFRLEAEAVARLQHPWIVQVHDHGQHEGQPYLILELVGGGSLAQLLQQGPLAPREAARLVGQLAEAVHYAHQRGIIHRDLKPANILLQPTSITNSGTPYQTEARPSRSALPATVTARASETWAARFGLTPKIADFGLAQRYCGDIGPESGQSGFPSAAEASLTALPTRVTVEGEVLGTPAYMAPEQLPGERGGATAATDIFALGIILYECLTGRPPFLGEDLAHTLELVQRCRPTPPRRLRPGLPRRLEAIALRCLARLPARRYDSGAALAQALRAWQMHRRQNRVQAAQLVEALRTAPGAEVPRLLEQLKEVRAQAWPLLLQLVESCRPGSATRLRVRLALLPGDSAQLGPALDDLRAHLSEADPEELSVLRQSLLAGGPGLAVVLWQALVDPTLSDGARLRAAGLLAGLEPDDPRWQDLAPLLARQLLRESPLSLGRWKTELQPVRAPLAPALAECVLIEVQAGREHLVATQLLADLAEGDVPLLAQLLVEVKPPAFDILLSRLSERRPEAIAILEADLPSLSGRADGNPPAPVRHARAAVALLRLGHPESIWPLFRHGPRPDLRTELLHALATLGADPLILVRRLLEEPDVSACRALVLALGEFPSSRLPAEERAALLGWLRARYREASDSGLHAAIGWLLRTPWADLDATGELDRMDEASVRPKPTVMSGPVWRSSGQGLPFVLLRGPVEFLMGSPEGERNCVADERRHRRLIPRSFALAVRKVSVTEFEPFFQAHPKISYRHAHEYSENVRGPAIGISWFQAAAYCRWLSEREGVPEDQMAYPSVEQIIRVSKGEGTLLLPADFLERIGYRLPTEAEWEFACRAGADTARAFGDDAARLRHYAWYNLNSDGQAWSGGRLKPNDLGLSDMLGNVWEWCQDRYGPYPTAEVVEDRPDAGPIRDSEDRVLRGGSYVDRPALVRAAFRCRYPPDSKDCSVGFRIARTV